jgi:hypothetical protein
MPARSALVFFAIVGFFLSCKKNIIETDPLIILRVVSGTMEINIDGQISEDVPVDRSLLLEFSKPVDPSTASNSIVLKNETGKVEFNLTFFTDNKKVAIYPVGALQYNSMHKLILSDQLRGANGERFENKSISFQTILEELEVVSVQIADREVTNESKVQDVPLDPLIECTFTYPIQPESFENALRIRGKKVPALDYTYSNENSTVTIVGLAPLEYLSKYTFQIANTLEGSAGEKFSGYDFNFYTTLDSTSKFPQIPEQELLTKVQEYTFKYFWDFGHPVSGLS